MDIKLTPYLSKMPTDGESVNAKKDPIKKKEWQEVNVCSD